MQTGFEARVAASPSASYVGWTTLAEEADFWAAITALGPRVRVRSKGVTVAGSNLLRSVEIGYPTVSDAVGRPAILLVAQQHGTEAAGREALFQLVRDWATTTDPAALSFLRAFRIVCLPTCNPDGLPQGGFAGTRNNGSDVDINRDHYALTQIESRVIQRAITVERPIVLADSHEASAGTKIGFGAPNHPAAYRATLQHSAALVSELIAAANASGLGIDGDVFAGAAASDPVLRQAAGLRGTVSVLIETDVLPTHPTMQVQAARVAAQRLAYLTIIGYALRNRGELIASQTTAHSLGDYVLAYPDRAVYEWGNSVYAAPPPAGYTLTASQRESASVDRVCAPFGLIEEPIEGGVQMSISGQYPLLPLLLDARSSTEVAEGVAISHPARQPGYGLQQPTPDGLRRAPRMINGGNGWALADARVRVGESWQ